MIVPDINLLLYAVMTGFPEHARARKWLEGILGADQPVGFAEPVVFGFIRLSTSPRVFDRPLEIDPAIDHVRGWLDQPCSQLLLPGPRHLDIAFDLLKAVGSGGNLTTDVQIAALAIEYQAELHSNDNDFGRFDGLRWVNPLNAK